jgi:hypothetical protein
LQTDPGHVGHWRVDRWVAGVVPVAEDELSPPLSNRDARVQKQGGNHNERFHGRLSVAAAHQRIYHVPSTLNPAPDRDPLAPAGHREP